MSEIPTRNYLADRLYSWAKRQDIQHLLLACQFARNLDSGEIPVPHELTTNQGLKSLSKEVLK